MRFIDLTGQTFGRLHVDKRIEDRIDPNGRKRTQYECTCMCGNKTIAVADMLKSGNKQSCGCLARELSSKRREINLVGMVFGYWTIESEAFRDINGIHWNARCKCGNTGTPTTNNLRSGISKSCGCYNLERISEREKKDITNQKFYKLTAIECVGKNEYNNYLWKCICECGREIITTAARLLGEQIVSCGCTRSKGECIIEDVLRNNKISYTRNFHFDDLKYKGYLLFDFALKDSNDNLYLIEYQGLQHYEDLGYFGKQQREITDDLKREYCHKMKIPLYEIKYDENIEIKLKEIIAQVNPVLSE